MKILVLTNFDVGLYKFRKELLKAFIDRGHEVVTCFPEGDLVKKIKALGCKYIPTPELSRRGMNPLKDIALYNTYKRIIKTEQPDFVITYTIKPNIYGGMAARALGVPYALNITGLGTAFQNRGPVRTLVKGLYMRSTKKAKKVFFENVENAAVMEDNNLVRKDQIVINRGAGVNTAEYEFKEYPIDVGKTRFLFMGRVMKEKGVDELFWAAEQLREKYGDEVEVNIVGPYEEDYSDTVISLAKQKVIVFYGFQPDVKPFITACLCFVLPSYHEGMANTLLESGSMGRPIITSNIHGCKEAVSDGLSGFLAEPQNKEDLLEKMETFHLLPYEDKVAMAKASANLVRRRFEKEKVIEKTIKALEID